MPAAHAANWFAATMALFLFYRKSIRFMLPLALANLTLTAVVLWSHQGTPQ